MQPELKFASMFHNLSIALYPLFLFARDVIIVSDLFGSSSDLSIYKNLMYEVQNSGVPQVCRFQSEAMLLSKLNFTLGISVKSFRFNFLPKHTTRKKVLFFPNNIETSYFF